MNGKESMHTRLKVPSFTQEICEPCFVPGMDRGAKKLKGRQKSLVQCDSPIRLKSQPPGCLRDVLAESTGSPEPTIQFSRML